MKKESPSRLTRVIAAVLTALFIPTIFAGGVYGLATHWDDVLHSLRFSKSRSYLENPDDTSFFAMTRARIQSLQAALGDSVALKDQLGHINASFQYGLGKELVVAGSWQLLKLPGGQLYALSQRETLADEAQEAADFYEQVKDRAPFLFAYVNPQFYEGSVQLPEGYRPLDTSDALADEVLGIIRQTGAPALDSREFLGTFGLTDDEAFYRTDMHWTNRAALRAAQYYAGQINDLTGSSLDSSRLDEDQMNVETYENLFLGEYGQQVGAANSGLDDVVVFTPKYETSLSRTTTEKDWSITEVSGSFGEAVLKREKLEPEADGISLRAYAAYGLVEKLEVIENHGDCEDMTILIYRDSYTAPVGSFLSLLAKKVVMVDMRGWDRTAESFVEEYDPDVILFAYSRQMFEDHGYDLGVEK